MSPSLWIQLSAQAFSILVGVVSFRKKSVSVSGLIALLTISGLFIWMNHLALLLVLFSMFASSSILTRYKSNLKKEFEDAVAKTGPRDYIQALANLGVATLILFLYVWNEQEYLIAAFAGSVAAGNADSWASEIGGISRQRPVMITNFRPVPKGISGGVTLAGTLGGIAGSFFISIITIGAFCLFSACPPPPSFFSLLHFWPDFPAACSTPTSERFSRHCIKPKVNPRLPKTPEEDW